MFVRFSVVCKTVPNFGLHVPSACPDIPAGVLDPKATWSNPADYDATAQDVARRFELNFKQFEGHVDDGVKAAAIRAAA